MSYKIKNIEMQIKYLAGKGLKPNVIRKRLVMSRYLFPSLKESKIKMRFLFLFLFVSFKGYRKNSSSKAHQF